MTGNPRLVLDDDDDHDVAWETSQADISLNTAVVKPVPVSTRPVRAQTLVKPVAMKVVRPIPKRISEQFYNEAFQDGLTLQETNQAVVLAHEWHRRWTQQEEANHTMPDRDFYEADPFSSSPVLPSHYALDLDRQGAKNPSLSGSEDAVEAVLEDRVKRGRQHGASPEGEMETISKEQERFVTGSSWMASVGSNSSSLSSYMAPNVKRRFTGHAVVSDDQDDDVDDFQVPAPMPIRPVAVRPVPVRLSRPGLPPPTQQEPLFTGIPQDITALREDTVSPMSCSPESSSLSGSFNGNNMATVLPPQQEDPADMVHVVEDELDHEELSMCALPPREVEKARDDVLHALAVTKGDVDSDKFKGTVDPLEKYFSELDLDTRPQAVGTDSIDGMWLTLSKPNFFGCLGENDNGDPMYTLGRMSFDMFSPTNLVCSLQGNFNPVEIVNGEDRKAMLDLVPKSLREEVETGETVLRTYHVVTAFTIEPCLASFPDAPNKDVIRPIKGIMTTYGYSLPDPNTPNRHSIWFTGGRIEPNNESADIISWKKLFTLHPPKHSFGEKAKLLAVKLLMGATVPEEMTEDGSMEYTFTRPLGGHGMAYIDVIYLDESMRIVRGHRGTTFVFSRVPER